MAVYYVSACHDCKKDVMWLKCPEETAKIWHKDFHKGHNTVLFPDTDDDLYYSLKGYKSLGVQDGDEWNEDS